MAGYYPREVTIGEANTAVGELVLHMQVSRRVAWYSVLGAFVIIIMVYQSLY